MRIKQHLKRLTLASTAILFVFALTSQSMVSASFVKHKLMSDSIFDQKGSMSAGEIDSFLNSFGSSCISKHKGFKGLDPTGYSPSGGYKYGSWVSAGTVIKHAAKAYDINPRVLLATLQKEQSLVTGTAGCSKLRYVGAMGYGCPDSGTTHSYSNGKFYKIGSKAYGSVSGTCVNKKSKAGFSQQVIRGAWLLAFGRHRSEGQVNWAIIKGSWDNSDDPQTCYGGPMTQGNHQRCPSGSTVHYDGYTTIDGQSTHMDTGATASLYWYTPHFSGNQHFVNIYESWWGSTTKSFGPMKLPRWMQTSTDTHKKDPYTGENAGNLLPEDQQIQFKDKITVDGTTYIRTAYDKAHDNERGIPVGDLGEIPYENMETPRWLALSKDKRKKKPSTGHNASGTLSKNRKIYFTTKITVNGKLYLRTGHDTDGGIDKGIPYGSLKAVPYKPFKYPRWMQIKSNGNKVDPITDTTDASTVTAGSKILFTTKITLGGSTYYRTQSDSLSDAQLAVPASNVKEVPYTTYNGGHYCMQLSADTQKVIHPSYQTPSTGMSLSEGRQICLANQIAIDGTTYYQTVYDANRGRDKAIPASDFEEIAYEPFVHPRSMELVVDAFKKNPLTGGNVDSQYSKGQDFYFNSKIYVSGDWYYRTQTDQQASANKAFPASYLTNA